MFGEFIRQPMLLHKGLWFTAIRLFCFRSGTGRALPTGCLRMS